MPYDEELANRLRKGLSAHPIVERKMFGGLSFLLHGHMCCGVVGDDIVIRVGPEAYASALKRPHARPMDFTGKALTGFVYVDPQAVAAESERAQWLGLALDFVLGRPPKTPTKARD